jgi:hypothetical protein
VDLEVKSADAGVSQRDVAIGVSSDSQDLFVSLILVLGNGWW